jgi:hypothetical protein
LFNPLSIEDSQILCLGLESSSKEKSTHRSSGTKAQTDSLGHEAYHATCLCAVDRKLEGNLNMALGTEVVDLIRLCLAAGQVKPTVSVMKGLEKPTTAQMGMILTGAENKEN